MALDAAVCKMAPEGPVGTPQTVSFGPVRQALHTGELVTKILASPNRGGSTESFEEEDKR
jgi:hypothetical protein